MRFLWFLAARRLNKLTSAGSQESVRVCVAMCECCVLKQQRCNFVFFSCSDFIKSNGSMQKRVALDLCKIK